MPNDPVGKLELRCTIDDCPRQRYRAMTICEAHYYRKRRYGDPRGGKYQHSTPRGDFWAKVQKSDDPNDCWFWLAAKNKDGYGQWKDPETGVQVGAHVAVYEKLVGLVPAGKELDHSCFNRACVNPTHLGPVTHEENLQRRRPWTRSR